MLNMFVSTCNQRENTDGTDNNLHVCNQRKHIAGKTVSTITTIVPNIFVYMYDQLQAVCIYICSIMQLFVKNFGSRTVQAKSGRNGGGGRAADCFLHYMAI